MAARGSLVRLGHRDRMSFWRNWIFEQLYLELRASRADSVDNGVDSLPSNHGFREVDAAG